MGTRVRPVRFNEVELAVIEAAAASSGLRFNAWVRRACREAAELERAIAREGDEPRVGLEREGLDWPLPEAGKFKPDFGRRLRG